MVKILYLKRIYINIQFNSKIEPSRSSIIGSHHHFIIFRFSYKKKGMFRMYSSGFFYVNQLSFVIIVSVCPGMNWLRINNSASYRTNDTADVRQRKIKIGNIGISVETSVTLLFQWNGALYVLIYNLHYAINYQIISAWNIKLISNFTDYLITLIRIRYVLKKDFRCRQEGYNFIIRCLEPCNIYQS